MQLELGSITYLLLADIHRMGEEPRLFLAQCNWGIKAYDLKVLLILNPNNKCA